MHRIWLAPRIRVFENSAAFSGGQASKTPLLSELVLNRSPPVIADSKEFAHGGLTGFEPLKVVRGLWAEMGSTPQRWRRAARIAAITAIGAGATAALQISNALGLTLLFNMAAPEMALGLGAAARFLIGAALCQALGMALAGAMADSPLPHLTIFVALSLASGYLIYGDSRLGRLWVWVQVPVLTAFYLVLFDPDGFGWNDAQAFAGIALAVGILYAVNTLLWPRPAAKVLAQSLAETIERSRRRLKLLIDIWRGEGLSPRDDRPIASKLGYHLTLLGPAAHHSRGVEVPGLLLSAVMVAERVHNEIDRIAALTAELPADAIDPELEQEVIKAGAVLDAMLKRYAAALTHDGAAAGVEQEDRRAAPRPRHGDEMLLRLDKLRTLLETEPAELPHPRRGGAADGGSDAAQGRTCAPRLNRFLLRYTVRHTVALALAFVCGLMVNNAAMHAALWLLMIGGPPSHGATARKFTVRAIGAAAAMAMTAVGTILLAPNGTTIFSYMAAVFAGCLIMAYIGQGGGLLSYLSIGGTAFVIAFSGPGPRNDAFASIWTIWGISFGMLLRAAVSMVWREWPRRTLVEEFQPPLQALLMLVSAAHRRDFSAAQIEAAGMALIGGVREMLAVANDAQLEGRGAGIDAANLVDTLDTLRRIGFILSNEASLPASFAQAAADQSLYAALHARFADWLESLRVQEADGVPSLAPLREMVMNCAAPDLSPWELDARHARLLAAVRALEGQLCTVSVH